MMASIQRCARMAMMAVPLGMALPVAVHAQIGPTTGTQTTIQTGVPSTSPAPKIQMQVPATAPTHTLIPMKMPALPPGVMELLKLESDFSGATLKGGGKAFASYFADDGVTLSNGKPPVMGKHAIEAVATWNPNDYQLSWYVEGAQMGPSNDSGFTWGHYDTESKDKNGLPVSTSGRYMTFWKKIDGKWKVALKASAEGPPTPGDLPIPPTKPQ